MSDQVFINVSKLDTHGRLRCQPPTVTSLHYHDSQLTVDLRPRVQMVGKQARTAEEHARTVDQQMSRCRPIFRDRMQSYSSSRRC